MATPTSDSRRRPKPPPSTLVLFVRHGVTPTTGQVLPGRAAGLHLAEAGRHQAEAVAQRLAAWAGAACPASTPPLTSPAPPASASAGAAPPGAAPAEPGAREPGGPAPGVTASTSAHGAAPKAARTRGSSGPTAPSRPTIAAVYASPLERTRETATPIAAALGLRLKIERGLVECDFGEWTGAELKALMKLPEWTTVQRYPSGFRFPGGESFTGMQARMVDTVSALCVRHRGEMVVAVSHADPIKAVVADALGTHLDLFQRIVISPCSVTAISYGATGPMVLAVNSTGSLADLKPS